MKISDEEESQRIGLCTTCTHGHRVSHPRGGAAYWKCRLSETDSRFEKFPATPVTRCAGYQAVGEQKEHPGSS